MSINCKLCDKSFKNKIPLRHLKADHGITVTQYEITFGQGSTKLDYILPELSDDEIVVCRECGFIFKNIITNSHLSAHSMTVTEYREKHGDDSIVSSGYRVSVSERVKGSNNPNYGKTHSREVREKMSNNRKGIEAWNKGVAQTEEQKRKQSDTKRNKYARGEIVNPRKGATHTEETKKLLSEKQKLYVEQNKDKMSERGRKSYKTMTEKYGEDVMRKRMEDMRNNMTEESRKKSNDALLRATQRKRDVAYRKLLDFFEREDIEMIEYNDPYVKGRCACGNLFEVTRQNFTPSKYKTDYCQLCVPKNKSQMEMEVANYLTTELGLDLYTSDRRQIWPYELDMFSEEHGIAVEFCGTYWHSQLAGKGNMYHKDKLDMCRVKGISLIQVFEHEWIYNKDVVKSILASKFGKSEVIYARKCAVEEISSKVANAFLKENHLSGSGRSNVRYGMRYDGRLVGVMTLSNSNVTRKLTGWEINRMAFEQGINIVGGASRMFKKFVTQYQPEQVISFADLRYGEGNVYSKLGFNKLYDSAPNYWYFKMVGGENYLDVKHRFALRKNYKEGIDDPSKTEWENRQEQGWNRIFDCGHAKWEWKK